MLNRSLIISLGAVAALSVVACGGGGGGSSAPSVGLLPVGTATAAPSAAPVATATAAASAIPAGYARAAFSITVPKATGGASFRRAQTVGAGTQSITFTLLQTAGTSASGTPQTFALTSANPACTSGTNGLTCTLGVNAPLGLDVFLAQTFTNTDGTGSLTGSGAVQLDVQSNSANSASLSLTSQAQSVYLTSSSTYLGAAGGYLYSTTGLGSVSRQPAAGRQASSIVTGGPTINSMRVFVIALDSAGNTILNPSIYSSPISLQLIYVDQYTNPLFPGVPDVTLSVAYSASVDPGGCNGTSTTTSSFGAVQVCSPADVVTATINNVTNGSPGAVIIGSVGTSGYLPVPAPSTTPSPLPSAQPTNVGFIVFPVTVPTPTPAPTGTPAITFTDYNNNPITSVTSLALGTTTLPYNYVVASDPGFTGSFTLGGTCAPYATFYVYNYNSYYGYSYIAVTTTAAGSCTLTVSDGSVSASLPITVTTTNLVGH